MALIENGHALTVLPSEQEAALVYKLSTNAATLCGAIVKATATKIQGKKYVQVEGWLALAAAHGCLVSIRDVQAVEGGIRAIAELRRMSDQALLATAEGFVGEDEPTWAKRPMYARRAMAQTRASSRVCRTVFAFAVVLIDKDLGTTPAEEMLGISDQRENDWAEDARKDGLVRPDAIDAETGEIKSQYKINAAAEAKKFADNVIGTFNLSGQSTESLTEYWNSNARKLEGLKSRHPAQYERVDTAYNNAKEAAEARAAA